MKNSNSQTLYPRSNKSDILELGTATRDLIFKWRGCTFAFEKHWPSLYIWGSSLFHLSVLRTNYSKSVIPPEKHIGVTSRTLIIGLCPSPESLGSPFRKIVSQKLPKWSNIHLGLRVIVLNHFQVVSHTESFLLANLSLWNLNIHDQISQIIFHYCWLTTESPSAAFPNEYYWDMSQKHSDSLLPYLFKISVSW